MKEIELVDWGVLDYEESLARQREIVSKRQAGECGDMLIAVEHPHVFTLGRRREAQENVLAPGDVPVVEIERGGDVTYHGPGQIVIYPICLLDDGERDLHLFLRNMEEGIINALAHYDLAAGREEGKTGVWIHGRKLASMGIACRKWITFHGLALNVHTDLSYFQRINPCGFSSSVMTSVQAEIDRSPLPMTDVLGHLQEHLCASLMRKPRSN
ncbi:MAG: lipoyl(octanoyl) transferase LipB [Myxococcales bacterium]|nr:lipoyl(octanoyl) transferase LipB [Myxococcales bacterium]